MMALVVTINDVLLPPLLLMSAERDEARDEAFPTSPGCIVPIEAKRGAVRRGLYHPGTRNTWTVLGACQIGSQSESSPSRITQPTLPVVTEVSTLRA